jgi:hypothetical protein
MWIEHDPVHAPFGPSALNHHTIPIKCTSQVKKQIFSANNHRLYLLRFSQNILKSLLSMHAKRGGDVYWVSQTALDQCNKLQENSNEHGDKFCIFFRQYNITRYKVRRSLCYDFKLSRAVSCMVRYGTVLVWPTKPQTTSTSKPSIDTATSPQTTADTESTAGPRTIRELPSLITVHNCKPTALTGPGPPRPPRPSSSWPWPRSTRRRSRRRGPRARAPAPRPSRC